MTTTANLGKHREQLLAMMLDLQNNRAVLDGLVNWYQVFVFTGGHVPTAHWNLSVMTAYLEHPPTADCLSMSEIDRYRHLGRAIDELGHAGVGPRTLRCRYALGDKFDQAAAEIRVVADTLESSVTKAIGGRGSPLQSRTGNSLWCVGNDISPCGRRSGLAPAKRGNRGRGVTQSIAFPLPHRIMEWRAEWQPTGRPPR